MKKLSLTNEVRGIISGLKIESNVVFLGGQLPRPLYVKVNEVLELLGGKWNRKQQGHVFSEDPTDKIEDVLLTGEIVDTKKTYDFFETPKEIVDEMFQRALISPGDTILEPSAGRGAIADNIRHRYPENPLDCYEIDPINQKILRENGLKVVGSDFLGHCNVKYDRILMNPPFSKQQDIVHVSLAYHFLKPGGRLVAVMAAGIAFRKNSRTVDFMDGLKKNRGEVFSLPDGSFKASGTGVNTVLVTLVK
jgi:predicted RNA methylase